MGLSPHVLGTAAGVGWLSDCICDRRHQAQLIALVLIAISYPVYLLAVKNEDRRQFRPDILVLKEAEASLVPSYKYTVKCLQRWLLFNSMLANFLPSNPV